jgi:hypothetical protein
MRACAVNNFESVLRREEDTEVVQHDPMSVDDGDDVAEHAIAGVPNVLQQPQAHHREHYRLNAKHLETLKFLGPMCAGLPVANDKLKSMLKYAKSLDTARVRFLPKTPATAWQRLAKVRNSTLNSQYMSVPCRYERTVDVHYKSFTMYFDCPFNGHCGVHVVRMAHVMLRRILHSQCIIVV